MGLYDNTGLDPNYTPTSDIWQTTLDELQRRGIEIHGSLSQGKVDDGATAVVLKAIETDSGRVVAVKVYKNPNQQVLHRNGESIPMTNFFENERRMLAGLQQCPAVPRYFYSVDDDSALTDKKIQPFHVMEFITGQRVTKFAEESLAGDKKNRTERLTNLFQQVLRTIESIHQFGYLHRDISDGNVLVDRAGNIRLIDLAEASPLGAEHTRQITTPGLGTEGIASAAQQKVRAIQTDDVNHACTIGYALCTGRWKQNGETPTDWQRNLTNSGAPATIAKILTKGMKPRDTNRKIDPTVWNTAQEVDTAIDSYRDGSRNRRRATRWTIRTAVAAAFVLIVTYIGVWQFQQQAYSWNLNRLQEERIVLGEKPRKSDDRVREHVTRAKALEAEAAQARADGKHGEAANLLQQALAEIQQAGRLADDLEKITPLQAPLQAMLHDNQQWNTDCEAILERLTELQQTYLAISKQIESGDAAQAWQTMSQLQADLVHLINDNQQSYEIGELFAQFDSSTIGLDAQLAARGDYQRIVTSREQAEQDYFQQGRWPEAKTAILSQQQALQAFLQQHEDPAKKASRLAANVDLLNEQMAANQALQKQLKSLNDQLREKQSELDKLDAKNSDILIVAAKDRAERDAAAKQLSEVQTQLSDVRKSLQEKSAALAKTTADVESLMAQTAAGQASLQALTARLANGSTAWTKQSAELAAAQASLAAAQQVIERLKTAPGANAELAAFGDLKLGTKFTNSQGQVFVYLPPGKYEMGSPMTETGRDDDEGKNGTHTVTLTHGFFMAIHETTQGPYAKITGETPWKGQNYVREGADYPASYVSWDEANDKFIKRLNETERAAGSLPVGWEYRLPTEAQWEYAARAGTQTRFSFGDDESQLGKYAWYGANAWARGEQIGVEQQAVTIILRYGANAWAIGEQYARPVGQKLPNTWGLYDMMGNVWEWTADLYGDYPAGMVTNPTGFHGGSYRVLRGGSFGDGASYCRGALRGRYSSGYRYFNWGFRLALVQVSSQ
jgi:formylglycine-generating enzyme required for sulfatase activity/serine/threonine protein kinase